MKPKGLLSLLGEAWKEWGDDKADRLGAALAYYTIFSIGPVLVLMIAIMGFVLGDDAARGDIVGRIEERMGREGAVMIEGMIKAASSPGAGIFATIFGIVGLMLGVIGIFSQLKGALNTIWDVEPKKGTIWDAIKSNLFSFLIVGIAGVLLVASLSVSALLGAIDSWTGGAIPGGPILWQVINYAVSFGVIVVIFAMIFKFLPDAQIAWQDVWPGAAVTAVLFLIGQFLIALYLSLANVGSPFGAAGSLVIVLVWIFYSAQIFFFGAELTQVYAARRGKPQPKAGARRVTTGERAEQGLTTGQGEVKSSPWFK
jgi:membrane protein